MNPKDKGIQVRFITDNEYVSPKELADALKMVADTIRIVKDTATEGTKEESNRLENRLNNLSEQIKRMVENSEKRGLKDIESLAKKITKIQSDIQKDFQDKFDELVLPDVTPFLSRSEYTADRKAILDEAKTFFKDVELDTPELLRDKLETLKDDDRLDKTAIKGLDGYDEALASLSQSISSIPRGGGGSGGIEVFKSGVKVGGGSALNFTGAGVSTVENKDGRMTTVTITGGGGGDGMAIGGTITDATEGSVLFAGASGVLAQDNSNFFWNNTSKQLILGTPIDVEIEANVPLTIGGNINNYWGPYFQNQSTGDTASADLILGANNDSSAIAGHYINIGVNGQNYVGTTSATGIVKTVSVNTAGTGYTVGDLLTLVGGSSDAEVEVLTVSAGAVTSVKITLNGTNYTVTNFATTGGTGTGCIINVLTLYDLSGLLANDTYLIGEGGNLAIGTGDSVASKSVRFFTNGFATANERMRIGTTGNVSIGSATDAASKLDVTTNGLGITQTDTSGIVLANTTAATSGVTRQISPALRMRGSAWKSDATAASQTVDFRQYASVNTGTSTVSGDFFWQTSINGGAYSSLMGISSVGVLTLYQGNTRTLDINASSASIVGQRIYNTGNASTSAHARYEITTGGASGGDPYTAYTVNGVTVWSQGIDNSDGDAYKISESATLGTSDRLILRVGGLASIRAGLATAKQATLGGSIKEYFASVGNVGTGEDDLFTYTTEANIFGTNGDKIQGQYSGTTAANANNKTIKLYFAGTNILSSTALALNDKNWKMDFTLIRVSATVVRYTASFTYEGNTAEILEVGELTGLTLSGTNILKITGEATATNDIVATMGTVTANPVSI